MLIAKPLSMIAKIVFVTITSTTILSYQIPNAIKATVEAYNHTDTIQSPNEIELL